MRVGCGGGGFSQGDGEAAGGVGAGVEDGHAVVGVGVNEQQEVLDLVDIGPPEEPTLLQRALELMHAEFGIDDVAIGHGCALPAPVLTSLVRDAVTSASPRPKVDVL